jgi:hypothetical protein
MTLLPKPASPLCPDFLRLRGVPNGLGLGVRRGDRIASDSSEGRATSLSPVGTSRYAADAMLLPFHLSQAVKMVAVELLGLAMLAVDNLRSKA